MNDFEYMWRCLLAFNHPTKVTYAYRKWREKQGEPTPSKPDPYDPYYVGYSYGFTLTEIQETRDMRQAMIDRRKANRVMARIKRARGDRVQAIVDEATVKLREMGYAIGSNE